MKQTNQTTKPTATGGGRKFRNDLIFIAAILVIVAIGAAALFFLRGEGSAVQVEVDGTIVGTYSSVFICAPFVVWFNKHVRRLV